jgi:aspartyl-tRNA(Asn)/glutamyl-tRNA(Gln) amidotransferase subunit A
MLDIAGLGRAYRRHALSPVEVTKQVLADAEAWEPHLNAIITLTPEQALAEARAAEAAFARGEDRGPLQGIPISLKDLFETRGIRTTAGSPILRDWVPDRDATVVTRLRQAGAVLFAKTNMLEFAYGVVHPDFGYTRNPWDLSRSTSGSSSGSAALVAAGVGAASIGSDTGGSIRLPAAWCGITGLKPTYGRVSRAGAVPLSWSLDHVGPLTRTPADAAAVLQAIAGPDPKDPTTLDAPPPDDYLGALSRPLAGLKVGVLREAWAPCGQETQAAVDAAVHALGLQVVEASVPCWPDVGGAYHAIVSPEASAFHEKWLRQRPGDYSEAARIRLELGLLQPAVDLVRAQRFRRKLCAELDSALRRADILAMPTAANPAARIADAGGPRALTTTTGAFNLAGLPAISVPCGFSSEGLPFGLQLAARAWDEATLLAVANAYVGRGTPTWPSLPK